jgi:outer membrane immunogenic protein
MHVLLRPAPLALVLSAAIASLVPASAQTAKPYDAYKSRPTPAYAAPSPMPVSDNRRPLDYSPRSAPNSGVTYRKGETYRDTRSDLGNSRYEPANLPSIWAGAYVGAHGGMGWGKTDIRDVDAGNIPTRGGLAGLHAGYNWQNGAYVIGLEGDISGHWSDGSRGFVSGISASASSDWSSSLRGRLGYSVSNVLVFGTGGVAFANRDLIVTDGVTTVSSSDTQVGYVIGAGLEMKLSPLMSLRGEVLHYGFAEKDFDFPAGRVPVRSDETVVRAGLSMHFN